MTGKIALALEPETGVFAQIPLLVALEEHLVFPSWKEAEQVVFDLAVVAPQLIWVLSEQREKLEKRLAELAIRSREVSKEEAERISAQKQTCARHH